MMKTKTSFCHCLSKKVHKSFLMLSSLASREPGKSRLATGVERSVAESGKLLVRNVETKPFKTQSSTLPFHSPPRPFCFFKHKLFEYFFLNINLV